MEDFQYRLGDKSIDRWFQYFYFDCMVHKVKVHKDLESLVLAWFVEVEVVVAYKPRRDYLHSHQYNYSWVHD